MGKCVQNGLAGLFKIDLTLFQPKMYQLVINMKNTYIPLFKLASELDILISVT